MKFKKFNKSILVSILILTLLSVSFLTGCTPEETSDGETQTIRIGIPNYIDSISLGSLAAALLEDELGYEAEIVYADLGPVYSSLASGELDAHINAWLPITHASYYEAVEEDIDDLGAIYEGARLGLVVPEYVDVNSIEELNEYSKELGGQIIGIDPGAGLTAATFRAIEDYDLDLIQVESSEAAMIAALSDAIDNEEWIVVAGWAPHWKFAQWDLKFLDDPQKSLGEEENVHVLAKKNFREEFPEAAQLLENLHFDDTEMGSLIAKVDEAGSNQAMTAVREWIQENEATVQSWLP